MVGCDGSDYGVTARLNSLDSIRSRAVLQDDLELRELRVDRLQGRQEARLGIHDCDVLLVVAGTLAVDVLGIIGVSTSTRRRPAQGPEISFEGPLSFFSKLIKL